MKTGRNGVTENTPKNILLGAGTIHKNLKYNSTWNFDESIVGATKGGSKLMIKPEIVKIEPDGSSVAIKGLETKQGETATMEINFLEVTKDLVQTATLGKTGVSKDNSYDVIESKEDIVTGDYWDNIAFVGRTLEGKNIIAILDNALCTSGFESEGKNKEESVGKYVFECHADLDGDLVTLPWHIYYPKNVEVMAMKTATTEQKGK